ncbi:hypothetical protein K9N68_05225 [Kovacikia minuta CCNUW1]|uniref:hypothetical protein n=1 Tax=Kovacikia minuta TaxID=2931930 RepID=UPI001CCCB4BC|nr:hypothetical protein [Kovacikia minuta]UBF27362.1 hypothetical protein K9N68_05225 [Kovacikia minuta CCNUW1]
MVQLTLGKISLAELKNFVTIQELGIQDYDWLRVDTIELTESELQQLQVIQSRLVNLKIHLLNEATIWARAIYPLLLLAEHHPVQAWSQVPLSAKYSLFEIEGIADGVLANSIAGYVQNPYLVVVEAKRGLEAQNPQFQLYGQLLASARLNWESDRLIPQEMFGCYTIADTWTFFRAEVSQIDNDKPLLILESSPEYGEKLEAKTILKILKGIVSRRLHSLSE